MMKHRTVLVNFDNGESYFVGTYLTKNPTRCLAAARNDLKALLKQLPMGIALKTMEYTLTIVQCDEKDVPPALAEIVLGYLRH